MARRPLLALASSLVAVVAAAALVWWLWQEARTSVVAGESGSAGSPGRSTSPARGADARPTAVDAGARAVERPRADPGVMASFAWGSGPNQLGRSALAEGNSEAPMSLTTDGAGTTWILDQVNGRLAKVDRSGRTVSSVPLPVQAAQDVAIAKDGTIAVMDRLADKSIALMGPDGRPVGELKLQGKGLPEAGGVTGVFVDGADVYAEREHGDLVKLGSTKGVSDAERPEVPGRPSRDGHSWLTASIGDRRAGTVLVTAIDRPAGTHRFTRPVPVGQPVVALDLLDSDASGIIYVGALVELDGSTPEVPRFGIALVCLDPLDGRLLGRTRVDASTVPGETFRELVVPDEGGILFLRRTDQGAQLERLSCS